MDEQAHFDFSLWMLEIKCTKMLASVNHISCNFSCFLALHHRGAQKSNTTLSSKFLKPANDLLKLNNPSPRRPALQYYERSRKKKKRSSLQNCASSISEDPVLGKGDSDRNEVGNDGGGDRGDWTTSVLLFLLWAALMYYIFYLAPDQTPSRDLYFVKKLSNLVGDDGFRMNQVLVSIWYIMGLWPIVYGMLLLPLGRSSKSNIPVWPFLTLSFFGGAYILIPYFILWRPPPPPVEESELSRWPLNFLESKITAGVLGAAGLVLMVHAGLANGDWKEFFQYFRESKLVHATSLDFCLLSAFAPFWVYNDMTARKCYDKTAWLLPLSIIPFLGPVLCILLRPSLTTMPVSLESTPKSD